MLLTKIQWGTLALIKVLRDPSNRPYAFVQYTNDADAKRALKEAQHTILNGRTIRCEPAKVNRTLYIATSNDTEISSKEVMDMLGKYGEIEQVIGDNDSNYKKSNFNRAWFCQFAYRDDAIRAYANLRLSPNWIVEWAQNIEHPSDGQGEPSVEIDKCSIFVGQLDGKVTKELLAERFSNHGKVADIVLVLRAGNNFAFIRFETEQAAAAAVERENHAVFMDKTMHVQYRELHHKKSRFSSQSTRLNLAPPPVNLPVRRSSTGSGYFKGPMGHFTHMGGSGYHRSYSTSSFGSKGKFSGSRSLSLAGERTSHTPKFFAGAPPFEPEFAGRMYATSAKFDDNSYSSTEKHTPVSSPSNQTMNSSSHGEAKSVFTATSISGTSENPDHSSTNYAPKHPHRRSMSHMIPSPSSAHMVPPPYYYYAYPEDCMMQQYDGKLQSYVPYVPFPYYPESSFVGYPPQAPTGLLPGMIPPGPPYMYYGIPPVVPNAGDDHGKTQPLETPALSSSKHEEELDY